MNPLSNRHRTPLTPDEAMAERYVDRPGRLFELAQATGNRALLSLALQIKADRRRESKRQR